MLLRTLPSLTAGGRDYQCEFQSRWGRENCIIYGQALQADFGPCVHTLSIRAAWGGSEYCHVGARTLGVDDDNFLILNHGRVYSTSIHAQQPVESFAICFRPELAESVYGAVTASVADALAKGDALEHQPIDFAEHLQAHERGISPVLRFIKAHLLQGVADEGWYEEQLLFLLERMIEHRDRTIRRIQGLSFIRGSTRREIYRRIGFATDYLHTCYMQPLDLPVLASVACLSKYYFLRMFTQVHGITPLAYLQRKRTDVAVRLLRTTTLTMSEVAARVGFAERSTLLRRIRRGTGLSASEVRRYVAEPDSQRQPP
jgi:AraC family transcriptional regulator